MTDTAESTQVGGDHYKKLAIQPMRYSELNNLSPCQHTAIKYITRFRDKDGLKDLEKASHCIDLLIEMEHEKELVRVKVLIVEKGRPEREAAEMEKVFRFAQQNAACL